MGTRRLFVALFILVVAFSLNSVAQPKTYDEFFQGFINRKAEQVQEDADQLDQLLDRWSNGKVSQSTVVAKLEEMEARTDTYIADILKLPAPEGEFEKYKQGIYVFVTWSNIIGIFREGLSDLNMSKLDAAASLSEYFQGRVERYESNVED